VQWTLVSHFLVSGLSMGYAILNYETSQQSKHSELSAAFDEKLHYYIISPMI